MRLPDWVAGRQGSGYRKMDLAHGTTWDVHLIDYPPGTGIPAHTDPLPGRRHLRVNVALLTGGTRLYADGTLWRWAERVVVFWSDRRHGVRKGNGRRLVLSLGISLKED